MRDYYQFFAFFGQTDERGARDKSIPTWDFQYVVSKPYMSIATEEQKQEYNRLKKIEDEAYKAFGGNDASGKAARAARDWAKALTEDEERAAHRDWLWDAIATESDVVFAVYRGLPVVVKGIDKLKPWCNYKAKTRVGEVFVSDWDDVVDYWVQLDGKTSK